MSGDVVSVLDAETSDMIVEGPVGIASFSCSLGAISLVLDACHHIADENGVTDWSTSNDVIGDSRIHGASDDAINSTSIVVSLIMNIGLGLLILNIIGLSVLDSAVGVAESATFLISISSHGSADGSTGSISRESAISSIVSSVSHSSKTGVNSIMGAASLASDHSSSGVNHARHANGE